MKELVLDISKWDPDIDLGAWKRKHNLWGVIIKFGGNEGGRYKDSSAERHYSLAKELGLHIGAYYYTTVTDVNEAATDAEHFANLLAGKEFDLPAYMDVEDSKQMNLGPDALTAVIRSFCDTLKNLGYYSGLYTSGSAWLNNMHRNDLYQYANWIAWWREVWPSEAGDIGLWQQGTMDYDTGHVYFDDVSGCVDFNWCVVDYPSRIHGKEKVIPQQEGGVTLTDDGLSYRAHIERAGWCPAVKDGQIAGTTGYAARLEAFKIRPTVQMGKLNVDAHIQGIGWKSYKGIQAGEPSGTESSAIDPIIGTVGEGRRLEAFKMELDGNKTGKKLRYMGHVEGSGWTKPVWEGEVCGTTGLSKRLEAIRIWLDNPDNPIDISDGKESYPDGKSGRTTDVIDIAFGELGYYAPNDPERGSKYGRWLAEVTGEDWLAGPSTEIWWCCMFVSWCLAQAGIKMDGFPTQNTDLALNGGAIKYAVPVESVQYGDIVIFNWDWDSYTDHIGFATGSFDGTGFTTIEGNVGNAVKEKYRQLGNVAYVLRPPYLYYGVHSGTQASIEAEPRNNRDGGSLEVDGIGGWNTIIDWQNQIRVIEDGWIDGQDYDNWEFFRGISNVRFTDTNNGSKTVATIQSIVGAAPDGIWGKETSVKIQMWLALRGYYTGDIDGYFGTNSVKALQTSLNNKAWVV